LGTSKKTPTGIPVELLMNTQDQKVKQRGKDGTAKTLEKVQFSTASMGKFDQMRQGEMERKKKGKRNQFLPVTGKEDTEKETSMKALKQVLGKEDKKRNANHFTETNEEENGRKKVMKFLQYLMKYFILSTKK
jgi:regulator of ribosome biosynthesis